MKMSDAILTQSEIVTNVGVSEILLTDGKPEICRHKKQVHKTLLENHCKHNVNESEKQNFNQAERTIRILKGQWKGMMIQKHIPLRLQDFVMKHEIELLNHIWNPQICCTPEKELTGNMPYISEYLDFGFCVYGTRT